MGYGLLDGLLFTLAGVAVAFVLMFVLWILGVCGGGDVKLYAAVGAWVGPWNVFPILGVAVACVGVVVFFGMAARLLRGKSVAVPASGEKPTKSRLATFAWPLAVGTLLVLAFLVGNDNLTMKHLQSPPKQEQTYAR